MTAAERTHVWSYDFVEDRTHDLRTLNVVDEFTHESPAIRLKAVVSSTCCRTCSCCFARLSDLERRDLLLASGSADHHQGAGITMRSGSTLRRLPGAGT